MPVTLLAVTQNWLSGRSLIQTATLGSSDTQAFCVLTFGSLPPTTGTFLLLLVFGASDTVGGGGGPQAVARGARPSSGLGSSLSYIYSTSTHCLKCLCPLPPTRETLSLPLYFKSDGLVTAAYQAFYHRPTKLPPSYYSLELIIRSLFDPGRDLRQLRDTGLQGVHLRRISKTALCGFSDHLQGGIQLQVRP